MAMEECALDDTEFGFGTCAQKILGAEYKEDKEAPTDAYAPLLPAEPETLMSAMFPLRLPGMDAREGSSMHGRTLSEGVSMLLLARACSQDIADLRMPRSAHAYDEFSTMGGEGSWSSMAGVGTPYMSSITGLLSPPRRPSSVQRPSSAWMLSSSTLDLRSTIAEQKEEELPPLDGPLMKGDGHAAGP
ncbi:hypothetical protein OBBRIDRAFT_797828 [Obba rivulosa]|uniref:Uncharacterized protein n=1 Tax=Obba rivulosa TaxID=1052685 RepID=A0A8E2DGC4_9APHY|nr:hypothetical protein OBBRIDRAFT_797828 [Obba rivulosa]